MLTGKILKLGNNINTDDIIAGKYLRTDNTKLWKDHIFETLNPELSTMILGMKFIVAGENFGCGSSREQAVIAIKSCDIVAIIAQSFGRIFYRNCINNGVLAVTYSNMHDMHEVEIKTGEEISLDIDKSFFTTASNKKIFITPLPSFATKIYQSGGLLNYYKNYEMNNM